MATFTVDGVEYELVGLDNFEELELDEAEVLEEAGGSLDQLTSGEVDVSIKLVKALVLISMRRKNPDATMKAAGRVKLSVLAAMAKQIANVEGDAVPPTEPDTSGLPDLVSGSA